MSARSSTISLPDEQQLALSNNRGRQKGFSKQIQQSSDLKNRKNGHTPSKGAKSLKQEEESQDDETSEASDEDDSSSASSDLSDSDTDSVPTKKQQPQIKKVNEPKRDSQNSNSKQHSKMNQ